jgi:hypothetical protein
MAGPSQFVSLVIVFDSNLVGMSLLPVERDAVLVVDPDAVPAPEGALEALQAITGRDEKVPQPGGDVERLEFSLRTAPDFSRDPSSRSGVTFAKEVRGGFVRE